MLNLPIQLPMREIRLFCQKWQVTEFAVFGSVTIAERFHAGSDIDVLLTYSVDSTWSLFDLVDMKSELEALFGRSVDIVNKRAVERSHNKLRRKAILDSAQVIHVA